MNDEFDGIFDDLSPADFFSQTTAYQEISRTNKGLEAFNGFVDEMLRAVQMAYAMAEGDVGAIAVLANSETMRMFVPVDEETVQNYIDRLNEEAKQMNAHWFFLARATKVGSHLVDRGEMHDATQAKVIEEAHDQGELQDGLFWYAERREDERQKRMGIYFDNGSGILERSMETPDTPQGSALLESVLDR